MIAITTSTPCREYRGATASKGYGVLFTGGRQVYLHRWVVEQVEQKPLARGEVVMHLCDNPPCFRYDHLRRATQRENMLDAVAKGRHVSVPFAQRASHHRRLTEQDAREIKCAQGVTEKQLAAAYGVTVSTVAKIRQGRLWRQV